ncbi:transcriptional regulator with XRE-family HTH domain [Streptococcus gallinaceus]|uniref:helix-turn-helix domain-containing protein n=1 Tax=Streptococcus gallinaceus TaxID=165758 RepID=UPI00209F8574|nr:helix-turn-helix transcriptional regulator [Streptococcus gallinaceus]MCP1640065.1 transcriptional regulator with XRE-family HTH domain [Streptococcus gallinaceus]MCP1770847.1 transcriptional regulator with XRE-family HTH domain [Streptococcus gallinaceus]
MSDINDIFEKPPTRIRELIIKSGKKLKEISKEADIPYGALSSYNQGIRTPKKENALKLANYFGVSVPFLLGRDSIQDKKENTLKNLTEDARFIYLHLLYLAQSNKNLNILNKEDIQKLQSIHEEKKKTLKRLKELQDYLFKLESEEESLQNKFKAQTSEIFNKTSNENGEIELSLHDLKQLLNK